MVVTVSAGIQWVEARDVAKWRIGLSKDVSGAEGGAQV